MALGAATVHLVIAQRENAIALDAIRAQLESMKQQRVEAARAPAPAPSPEPPRTTPSPTPSPASAPTHVGHSSDLAGHWMLDTDTGGTLGGATLDVTTNEDVMNITGSPVGTLHLPALDADVRLIFRDLTAARRAQNLVILDRVDAPGSRDYGRWVLDESGRLTLDIAAAGPDVPELQGPIVMIKPES